MAGDRQHSFAFCPTHAIASRPNLPDPTPGGGGGPSHPVRPPGHQTEKKNPWWGGGADPPNLQMGQDD